MSFHRLATHVRALARVSIRSNKPVLAKCFPSFELTMIQHTRSYATKGKGNAKSTATMIPGSKQPITDPAAQAEYAKAEAAMQTAVEWYRKECAAIETRASGRVTPALLSTVRVSIPDQGDAVRLEAISTVGVRDGSTLMITVFEEDVRSCYH